MFFFHRRAEQGEAKKGLGKKLTIFTSVAYVHHLVLAHVLHIIRKILEFSIIWLLVEILFPEAVDFDLS